MQLPTTRTPVDLCERLALYAVTMLGKFEENATLAALGEKLSGALTALSTAQGAYAGSVRSHVITRVDVKFEDYLSDQAVRALQRTAENADKRKGGKIASALFPGGVTPIVQPVGAKEVAEMRSLEGRLDAARSIWPDAQKHKEAITTRRQKYESALESRRAAREKTSDLRSGRNAVKEDFLDVYAQVAARVEGEFPRDRVMQDLFFDRIWTRSRSASVAGDEADDAEVPSVPPSGATV